VTVPAPGEESWHQNRIPGPDRDKLDPALFQVAPTLDTSHQQIILFDSRKQHPTSHPELRR